MDGDTLGLIEMTLVFGLVVGWGFWELHSLRRARERSARERALEQAQAPAGERQDDQPADPPRGPPA